MGRVPIMRSEIRGAIRQFARYGGAANQFREPRCVSVLHYMYIQSDIFQLRLISWLVSLNECQFNHINLMTA
jgi:hypothetical protein